MIGALASALIARQIMYKMYKFNEIPKKSYENSEKLLEEIREYSLLGYVNNPNCTKNYSINYAILTKEQSKKGGLEKKLDE